MKKILCMLMFFAILLSFCGCKKAKNNDKVDSEQTEVVVEEVVIQSLNDKTTSKEQNPTSETKPTVSGNAPISTSKPTSQEKPISEQKPTSSENKHSSDTKPNAPTTTEDEGIYKLNDAEVLKRIRLNGRCDKSIYGISLGMAASTIEFNTDSSAVMIEVDCAPDIYYTVVVDGEITQKRGVTTSGINYIFVRGLSAGTHNVKVIRDCEGRADKYFTVVSLQLDDGKLLKKDADKVVIEFLGDSITSGYGNIVINGAPNPQDLKNQSSMKSYAYLIADKLGFDYRIVSQSGIALTKRDGYFAFPDYYNIENYHINKDKKYTSSNPKDVDIVVVNLGTNDIGAGLYDTKNMEQISEYVKHYADLITTIGYRKDAKILFVSDVWHHDPAIADGKVANELKSRGYNNVYSFSFEKQYRAGGGAHPSEEEHQEMADTLIKFFKDNKII